METTLIGLLAAMAVIAVTALAPRTGVAAPLILVVLGAAVTAIPAVPNVQVPPEVILAGVLPPLLFSAAVSMPTMDFRRDLATIGGLSVILVLITSVLLGFVFAAILPGLGLAGGIALGAIVSPTDAVATSIVKKAEAPPRVVTVLEGEGLLNDASALVLLRSAVAATSASVSFGHIAVNFLWAATGAVIVGAVVGQVLLLARRWVRSAPLSTAVSFLVPFAAYLAAEQLRVSGFVAVVAAGLVTGYGSAKYLGPRSRFSGDSNWRTVDLLLEGGVFLLMGLELSQIVADVRTEHGSLWFAAGVAALAAAVVVAVRVAYVMPLLTLLDRKARRGAQRRDAIAGAQERLRTTLSGAAHDAVVAVPAPPLGGGKPRRGPHLLPVARLRRVQGGLVRRVADIDYLTAKPLGPREGGLLVWAGMRGVVTVAAAQSLPAGFPHRSLVVLVAFGVAAGTLLVQGGTLPWMVRRLGLAGQGAPSRAEYLALRRIIESAARDLLDDPSLTEQYEPDVIARVRTDVVRGQAADDLDEQETAERFDHYRRLRIRAIRAQRSALLAARATGAHDSQQLRRVLVALDAEQIMVEMKKRAAGS